MISSTTSTSYKATCIEGHQTLDVRRFLLPQELVGSFQHLKKKLVTVFPKLDEQNFSVFWSDNEGDDITITSDEDLRIALGEMDASVCKLIVKIREQGESGESTHVDDHSVHIPCPKKAYQEKGFLQQIFQQKVTPLQNDETLMGLFRGNNNVLHFLHILHFLHLFHFLHFLHL